MNGNILIGVGLVIVFVIAIHILTRRSKCSAPNGQDGAGSNDRRGTSGGDSRLIKMGFLGNKDAK